LAALLDELEGKKSSAQVTTDSLQLKNLDIGFLVSGGA